MGSNPVALTINNTFMPIRTFFRDARHAMVNTQLLPCGITNNNLIEAFLTVEKELFLPASLHHLTYADHEIHLEDGSFLASPLALARILSHAHISSDDLVLLLGCNTGYVAALLNQMGATIVESVSNGQSCLHVQDLMNTLHLDNIFAVESDPCLGYPKQSPYDVIIALGAYPQVPQHLLDQLTNNGTFIGCEHTKHFLTNIVIYQKTPKGMRKKFGEQITIHTFHSG